MESVLDRRHLKVKRRPGNTKPDFIKQHMGAPARILKRITAEDVPPLHRDPVDPFARGVAEEILKDISERGEAALLEHSIRLGDVKEGDRHILGPAEMKASYDSLPEKDRGVLDRTAARIKKFAETQRASISDDAVLKVSLPGPLCVFVTCTSKLNRLP